MSERPAYHCERCQRISSEGGECCGSEMTAYVT